MHDFSPEDVIEQGANARRGNSPGARSFMHAVDDAWPAGFSARPGLAREAAAHWLRPVGLRRWLTGLAWLLAWLGSACARGAVAAPVLPPTPPSASDPVLIAAGDIASCLTTGDVATAKLVGSLSGTVAVLGDDAYERGSHDEFVACFDPTWGQFKNRIRPAPGNHEYLTPGAQSYFDYFGPAARLPVAGQGPPKTAGPVKMARVGSRSAMHETLPPPAAARASMI